MPETLQFSEPAPVAAAPNALASDEKLCTQCGGVIKAAALKCRFCGRASDPRLMAQEEAAAAARVRYEAIVKYVRRSGVGWLIVSPAQLAFTGYLSATWGMVCLVMGIVSLAFARPGILIANGVAMMLIGVSNFAGSLATGEPGIMTYLGVRRVIWVSKS